jgi:phosphoglucosamine mutase
MSERLFGTDGIRARAGEFPLTAAAVPAIGQAIGEKLGGRILIGQDTRVSSPWIFDRLKAGIARTAAQIDDAGVIPTPAIALLTKHNDFAGGIMISASHNPYEDNGIKVFSSDGRKLSDADEIAVERRITEILQSQTDANEISAIPDRLVTAANGSPWPARYIELLLSHFPPGRWLQGCRVVVDCANGAMSKVAPPALSQIGAELVVINNAPTGTNINAGCGAVHLESLTAAMNENKADFGVAFDGDGDRSMFVSSSGRLIDGDAVLLLTARRLQRQGKLNPPVVVGTLMTNYSLERILSAEGIALTRVAVGDRYIFEEMQKSGAVLGGEPSGHIIYSDFRLSGDGLLTALKVAEAVAGEHASFDDLTRDWTPSPQLLKGVRVKQKVPLENVPVLQKKISEVTQQLKGRGRLVVRYSGTEPLLRVMVESDDASYNDRVMSEMLETISRAL